MDPEKKKWLWYLQVEGTEFGPFTTSELETLFERRKLKQPIYVWRLGMTNWSPASACPDLAYLGVYLGGETSVKRHSGDKKISPEGGDQRSHGRRPLIATVSVVTSARTAFLIGVCEDISLTGLQVILDSENEIEPGGELTLKVDPLGLTQVPAFQIRGKVMWYKVEEKRVGLSFGKLDAASQKSLQSYLKSARDRELASRKNLIEIK